MDAHHHNHGNMTTQEDHSGHMMMMMYFHTDIGMDNVLFKSWKPSTNGQMVYTCLLIVLLAFLYEGLKYAREWIYSRQINRQNIESFGYTGHLMNQLHLLQTALHGLQYLISYLLMLIAMTYQVYLFLAIILGAAIGYLVFSPLTAKMKVRYQKFGDPCCS